jgi:sugar phosphate permease
VAFVPSGVAVTQDVVHPGLCAVSLSLNIIIQHLFGSSLAPIVIGQLSDTYGLDKALTILPIFAFLAGVLLFTGSFYYKKDLYIEHSAFQDTDFPDQRIGFNKKTL